MIGAVLGAFFKALLQSAVNFINARLQRREDVQRGVDAQAAANTAAGEKTETAIANAEAQAPKDLGGVIDRAQKGTF